MARYIIFEGPLLSIWAFVAAIILSIVQIHNLLTMRN